MTDTKRKTTHAVCISDLIISELGKKNNKTTLTHIYIYISNKYVNTFLRFKKYDKISLIATVVKYQRKNRTFDYGFTRLIYIRKLSNQYKIVRRTKDENQISIT